MGMVTGGMDNAKAQIINLKEKVKQFSESIQIINTFSDVDCSLGCICFGCICTMSGCGPEGFIDQMEKLVVTGWVGSTSLLRDNIKYNQ